MVRTIKRFSCTSPNRGPKHLKGHLKGHLIYFVQVACLDMHRLVVFPEICSQTDIHQLNTLIDLKDDLRNIQVSSTGIQDCSLENKDFRR